MCLALASVAFVLAFGQGLTAVRAQTPGGGSAGGDVSHRPPPPTSPNGDDNEPDNGEAPDGGYLGPDALPPVIVRRLIADAATPVATGRGLAVTAGDLYQRVEDGNEPLQRQWAQNPALVEELLDRVISDRLMADEARRRGLDRDPAVRAVIERALVARLRATIVQSTAGDASAVTMDDIRRFYEANQYRFHIPERRRARVIFVIERAQAERVLRAATQRRHRRPVQDFRELARLYNTDPELVRTTGDLQNITLASSELDSELRATIFDIRAVGDVHAHPVRGVWRGTRGYFIVRLTARRPAIDRTLEDSADWIRHRVVLQRRVDAERALVERLAREAGVRRLPASQVVGISFPDAGASDVSTAPR